MTKISGVIAPVPTPLDGDLEFDAKALAAHLAWLASEGLDGVLILGTNGEFPSFSLEERITIAEAAVAADTSLDLILGVGSCALPDVLTMVGTAARLGFSAILCPPPFYFRAATPAGIAAFFLEVLNRSELPVLLYHIPQVTGVPISDAVLDRLGLHEHLAGIKDSTGDPKELDRLSSRVGDGWYLVGNDHLVTACIEAGGCGSITAAASVAPALVCAVQRGETDQGDLDALRALLEHYGLGPSVKSILRRCSLGEFATRPPLVGLQPDQEEPLWNAYCDLVPGERRPRR